MHYFYTKKNKLNVPSRAEPEKWRENHQSVHKKNKILDKILYCNDIKQWNGSKLSRVTLQTCIRYKGSTNFIHTRTSFKQFYRGFLSSLVELAPRHPTKHAENVNKATADFTVMQRSSVGATSGQKWKQEAVWTMLEHFKTQGFYW